MVSRGVVTSVDDSKKLQEMQCSSFADETLEGVEHFQPYGFTSVPLPEAEAVLIFPQGNRDHAVSVVVDDRRYRLKGLQGGEVALYTDEGDKIHIKRGGTIEVSAATKVEIKSPAIELGSDSLEKLVKGDSFKTLFNSHTHIGNKGYDTSIPTQQLVDATHLSSVSKTK
jgi:phage baseplate assembly protein V